jgi:hypothetical protein
VSDDNYRVAIVVFASVKKTDVPDEIEAFSTAELSIKRTLAGGDTLARKPFKLDRVPHNFAGGGLLAEVTVHEIKDLGVAAGNGYVWVRPTSKAYPRREELDDGE